MTYIHPTYHINYATAACLLGGDSNSKPAPSSPKVWRFIKYNVNFLAVSPPHDKQSSNNVCHYKRQIIAIDTKKMPITIIWNQTWVERPLTSFSLFSSLHFQEHGKHYPLHFGFREYIFDNKYIEGHKMFQGNPQKLFLCIAVTQLLYAFSNGTLTLEGQLRRQEHDSFNTKKSSCQTHKWFQRSNANPETTKPWTHITRLNTQW